MATEVKLPQLGQTMEEGTIVEFKVKLGDEVKKGDVIFEVETDKAALEVESPAEGFVRHIVAQVGQTLLVGDPVLILGGRNEEVPQSPAEPSKEQAGPAAPRLQPASAKSATPADITEMKLGQTMPLSRNQKTIAEKMLRSKREIPCFYLNVKTDVTDLVELRAQMNKAGDVKISYNDFIMRAVGLGLEKFPIMTGRLAGDAIKLAESIDIGLAIAASDGLVAPILRKVNRKDLAEVARESTALIEKARNNKLSPADLEGGCITISNLGAFGVETNTAIVIPGQCSILGVGKIMDACLPEEPVHAGPAQPTITVRKLMNLTLSVDHRIVNGSYAAQFLDFVRKLLEDTSTFTP